MDSQDLLISSGAFCAGVGSHLVFFKNGERHLYPMRYVQAYILAFTIVVVARSHYLSIPTVIALKSTFNYFLIYFTGIYFSLITYRLFFNPLNKFPGPYFARLSKFDHCIRNRKLNGHHKLKDLHDKHGKFVRIGPNDLSVTHPDGIQVVSAPNSKCTKGQWYSNDSPLTSMHTTRDRATHDRRRRVWAPAFSDRALRGYESRVKKYNDLMVTTIDKNIGKPMNMSEIFNHYSFDVMGDLAFGHSFSMLESGEEHWAIKLLNGGMDPLGFSFPPWFFRILTAIPGATKEYWQFITFCSDQLADRMKMQDQKEKSKEEKDITHILIDQYNGIQDKDAKRTALPMLQGDSRLIIVAGSDTTAATLVHLFYHLAADQEVQKKVREEVANLCGGEGVIEEKKIKDAEYLNGCINEALRLHPPVPSGVFRKTPKEGVEIAGTYVPGDTCIQLPHYPMGLGVYSPF